MKNTVNAYVQIDWHAFRGLCHRLHDFDHGTWNSKSAWCTHSNSRSSYVFLLVLIDLILIIVKLVSLRVQTMDEDEGGRLLQVRLLSFLQKL